MLDSLRTGALSRPTTPGDFALSWLAAGALALTVAVFYYLAAQLSLSLLTTPEGGAAFWPAAGIAVGALVAFGSRARAPVALGVLGAMLLVYLTGDRVVSVPHALLFAVCNAGEVVLIGWLLERYHGDQPGFELDSLPRVLAFLLATGFASAVSGLISAGGIALLGGTPAHPHPTFCVNRMVAHSVGILVIAPLLIGIVRAVHQPPRFTELLEGAGILIVLAVISALGFTTTSGNWFTILPLAMLLPLMLWPAARCPAVIAAAAIFVLALVIVLSATLGLGLLGDQALSFDNRLLATQTALLTVSTCTLVIAALFTERRTREALLRISNTQLRSQREAFRRLLGSLPAAIYTTDKAGRITYCNQAAIDLWQRRPDLGRDKWFDLWRLHYPDGSSMPLDDRPTQIALRQGRAVRGREALLERPDGTLVPIMPCPAPLLDEHGKTIGVVNMQFDLTERKQAQAALAERDALLTLASKAAGVGTYTVDLTANTVCISSGLASLYGLSEGTTNLTREVARSCVHPEDLPALDASMSRAWTEGLREHVAEFRIVRADNREERWIELRSILSYDDEGRPSRMVGVGIDVTEHKRAEEHQRLLLAELDHRVKNVLATVSAVASRTLDASRSGDDFAAALAGRIRSMAATHELLSGRQWKGVSVRALVRRVLAAYMTPGNTEIDGPEAMLRPESGQAISMVLHELATNAAKHGALSTEGGRVSVLWERLNGDIRITWQESGGPRVQRPQRSGYGTEVIRGLIPYELDGSVELAFEPGGVRCILTAPIMEKRGSGCSDNRRPSRPPAELADELIQNLADAAPRP